MFSVGFRGTIAGPRVRGRASARRGSAWPTSVRKTRRHRVRERDPREGPVPDAQTAIGGRGRPLKTDAGLVLVGMRCASACRRSRAESDSPAGPRLALRGRAAWGARCREVRTDARNYSVAVVWAAEAGTSDLRPGLTRKTGVGARRSTRSATLPMSTRSSPVRPWVAITIRSIPLALV